jgi:hypothetical protein
LVNYVTTRIVVTSRSVNCSEKFIFNAPSIDADGYMLKPALPFGTYDVCVDAITPASGTRRRKTLTGVRNWYHRGMKAPDITSPVIDMSTGTSSGSCP